MDYKNLIMGRASNIANKAFIDTPGMNVEPHYIFTESEFRAFVACITAEQKVICSQAAHDAIAHPLAEAQLAGDVIASCEVPDIF